jgi:hypothetical protein
LGDLHAPADPAWSGSRIVVAAVKNKRFGNDAAFDATHLAIDRLVGSRHRDVPGVRGLDASGREAPSYALGLPRQR